MTKFCCGGFSSDDEEMIRNPSRQMLSRLGHEPKLVKDGAKAIELYKKAMESTKKNNAEEIMRKFTIV